MDTIYCLLITFVVLTLIHLAFVIKFGTQIPVNLLFHNYSNENNKSNLETDLFRLCFFSMPYLFAPLAIYRGYISLSIENDITDIIVLLLLISFTIYLLYSNIYKIWNDKFRKIEKPKSLQDEFNTKTVKTLILHEEAINCNHKKATSIGNDLNKTKKILKNKADDVFKMVINNKNNLVDIAEKTQRIVTEIEGIKSETLSRSTKKKVAAEKDYASYFKNPKVFMDVEQMLENNKFKVKNDLTATNLCTLAYKLHSLNLIDIENKQTHFVIALAKYYKINHIDKTILSRTFRNFKDKEGLRDISKPQQKLFNSLCYLEKPHRT